jgi:hypothetical protein
MVLAFTAKIAEVKKDTTQDELIKHWNTIAPGYVINLAASAKSPKATTVPGSVCCFYYIRSKKECDQPVSVKSVSGKYCSKHLKEEGKPVKQAKVEVSKTECCYVNTKGDNVGKKCTSNVSTKSTTGKYCSKHAKTAEKEKVEKPAKEKATGKKKKGDADSKEADEVKFSPKLNKELKAYVDQASGFVINKESKKIYARVRDNKITALNDKDVEYLNEHEYEFDRKLFATKHPDSAKGGAAAAESKEDAEIPTDEESESSESESEDEVEEDEEVADDE